MKTVGTQTVRYPMRDVQNRTAEHLTALVRPQENAHESTDPYSFQHKPVGTRLAAAHAFRLVTS
ncbi:MAG: hypothetical protein Q8K43_07230 [Sulfurimicrobium sp.]|nr:hypothetical protein [Sulfurimicrobium sp.]